MSVVVKSDKVTRTRERPQNCSRRKHIPFPGNHPSLDPIPLALAMTPGRHRTWPTPPFLASHGGNLNHDIKLYFSDLACGPDISQAGAKINALLSFTIDVLLLDDALNHRSRASPRKLKVSFIPTVETASRSCRTYLGFLSGIPCPVGVLLVEYANPTTVVSKLLPISCLSLDLTRLLLSSLCFRSFPLVRILHAITSIQLQDQAARTWVVP
jgi:hypothetical protein